jgi:hypothetical protein
MVGVEMGGRVRRSVKVQHKPNAIEEIKVCAGRGAGLPVGSSSVGSAGGEGHVGLFTPMEARVQSLASKLRVRSVVGGCWRGRYGGGGGVPVRLGLNIHQQVARWWWC